MPCGQDGVAALGRRDFLTASLIFLATLLVFWLSPVSQVTDSHYSLLLSENLLKHRSFSLDQYAIPRLESQPGVRDDYVANGSIWQLEQANGHLYYYFPPGSSILSSPYVAIANMFGFSLAKPDGSYNPQVEVQLETGLAAILMAAFAGIVFMTARWLLPLRWSVIVALATALGTQVWSTTSRGLWAHTWEVLLVSLVVLIFVRRECGSHKIRPIVLATLLAWIYFVRPSGVVVILAATLYVFLHERRILGKYLLTGGVWLAILMIYSWIHFGRLLPSYYRAGRLGFDLFPVALAGNLISPARGLILYVPILLFVGYLLFRYRKYLAPARLVVLALFVIAGHLVLVSSFANRLGDWWGGASYGPRYSADLIPWFSLLGILGLSAWLKWRRQDVEFSRRSWNLQIVAGTALLALSVVINARGAFSFEVWQWSQPNSDRQMRALLWDWQHPQFLAGLQRPPTLVEVPLVQLGARIDFTSPAANKYLWYGWSDAEPEFRWTDGREATLVFALERTEDIALRIKAGAFVARERLPKQNVDIVLNGHQLETLALEGAAARQFDIMLPGQLLSHNNVLTLALPGATSPSSLGVGVDSRLLGIRVEWMEFQRISRQ